MKHEPTIHGYTLDSFEKEKQQYLNMIPFTQNHARHVEYLDEQIHTMKICVLIARNVLTGSNVCFDWTDYSKLYQCIGNDSCVVFGIDTYVILAVVKLKSII